MNLLRKYFTKTSTVSIFTLIIISNLCINCSGKRKRINERVELRNDFHMALEKKDFTNAFESFYKLKALCSAQNDKVFTQELIIARIPFLISSNEYKVAFNELIELNYWESEYANNDEFDFANRMLLKVFHNAVENLDFEFANKTLRAYRSYYDELYEGIGGDPSMIKFYEAENYNGEIKYYNETIFNVLYDQKSKVDGKELVEYFLHWAKTPYKIDKLPPEGNVAMFKVQEDKDKLKVLSNKLL